MEDTSRGGYKSWRIQVAEDKIRGGYKSWRIQVVEDTNMKQHHDFVFI